MDSCVKQIDKIVKWLRTKVDEAKAKGLVVGISGGIDSAVVAALVKRAFPNQAIGVILPCYSNPKDKEDALSVIEAVGIKSMEINLTDAHKVIFNQVKEALDQEEFSARFADANLRARLRMSTLYTVANGLNYLVVGTDNAAEVFTGYFTKYGDGGVDILPLSQFTKGEVRTLATALGIPDNIITKAPSAGLWEGQTDEVEMGITYDTIDRYLIGQEIPKDARQKLEAIHKKTQHKRELPPSYQRDDVKLNEKFRISMK